MEPSIIDEGSTLEVPPAGEARAAAAGGFSGLVWGGGRRWASGNSPRPSTEVVGVWEQPTSVDGGGWWASGNNPRPSTEVVGGRAGGRAGGWLARRGHC